MRIKFISQNPTVSIITYVIGELMKKNRIVITSFLLVVIGMFPVTQAAAVSVSVSPGDSYIWKIDQILTDNEGTNENMTIYRLINVTAVSQVIESTDITYDIFVANSSSYEGISLSNVNWNSTQTDSKLILNNTAPENSFGGFVNLDSADLTIISNMTSEDQTKLLVEMLIVSSPEFFAFIFVMTLIAAFSIGGEINEVNSTTLDTVKQDQIAGTLMFGYNIFFDSSNTWTNMSTTAHFDMRYGKSNKILQETSGTYRFESKSWNETTDVYETKFQQYETSAKLIFPEDAIESASALGDFFASIPSYPTAILGVMLISSVSIVLLKRKKNIKLK